VRKVQEEKKSASGGKNTVLIMIVALVAGSVGFFAGMKYQQSKRPSMADFSQMRQRGEGMLGMQRPEGVNMIRGEIIDKNETGITIKLPDESSKIILVPENAEINKAVEGSADDLKVGQQVTVFGQTNSDGSVSATNIQLGSGLNFSRNPSAEN
jgi:hypothetical protein